jgi:hypothetical protein
MREGKWTPEDTKKAVETIMHRALTDAAYREWVLANPSAAMQEAASQPLLAGVRVCFVENQPGASLTFVLPDLINSKELSEAELEMIAGGATSTIGHYHQGWVDFNH